MSVAAGLSALPANSPVGIFRTDLKGECTWVNDKWCDLTGCSLEAALGDGWQRAIHPEDLKRLMAEWSGLPVVRGIFCSEYRYLRPDGTVRWVLGRASEDFDSAGEVVGFIGVVVDITELRQKAAVTKRELSPESGKPPSRRELEVAQLLVEGNTNKQVADRLGISVRTVEAHRARLMRKLRLKSIVGLVRYAVARGL